MAAADRTSELTKRKCICRKVNRACRIGCANTMSATHLPSIVECMAISRPLNTSVARPKTATNRQINSQS